MYTMLVLRDFFWVEPVGSITYRYSLPLTNADTGVEQTETSGLEAVHKTWLDSCCCPLLHFVHDDTCMQLPGR